MLTSSHECCRTPRQVWRVAAVVFLLGVTLGLPITVLPQLQRQTFARPFAIAGTATALKGLLAAVLAPSIGAWSDRARSRRIPTMVTLASLVVPFVAWELAGSVHLFCVITVH